MTNPIIPPINNNTLTLNAFLQQDSPLLQLPTELINEILIRLNTTDISQFRLLCKQSNLCTEQDSFWIKLAETHLSHIDSNKVKNTEEIRNVFLNEVISLSKIKKGAYARRTPLQLDIGPSVPLKIFDGKLFISTPTCQIQVWDLKTKTRTATFQGGRGISISCVISDDKLISGSHYGNIDIWDLNSGNYIANLAATPYSPISSLEIFDGMLISGSRPVATGTDPRIMIWDLAKRNCIKTLQGQSPFTIIDRKLISANDQNEAGIKIWDLDTLEYINKNEEYEGIGCVKSIVIFDGKLISGSDEGTIKIWNLRSGTHIATLEGRHAGGVTSLIIGDGMLISKGSENTMKVWDLKTLACTASITTGSTLYSSPVFFNGQLMCGGNFTEIDIWDFRAEKNTIFEEIAWKIEHPDQGRPTTEGIERFSRLPKSLRDKIYGELYRIIKSRLTKDYWGCSEHAFHDTHGQSATPLEKAQAIRNYLAAERELEQSTNLASQPLLQHLGILTQKEFSEKLRCRPQYLQTIGITSAEDLKIICSLSPDIQMLMIEEDSGVQEDFRDDAGKRKAHQRQEALSDLSNQISQAITSKIQETNTCGVPLYDGECPWIGFKNRLDVFRTKFDAIVLECNGLPRLTVEAFKTAKYNELVNELNALVGQFQILDRNHQIAKLHFYINQWGIHTAWTRRNREGIQQTLKDLPESERTLHKLFQLGE